MLPCVFGLLLLLELEGFFKSGFFSQLPSFLFGQTVQSQLPSGRLITSCNLEIYFCQARLLTEKKQISVAWSSGIILSVL